MATKTPTGGLAAALAAAQACDPRKGCGVGRILNAVDTADHGDLEAALNLDSGISGAVLSRVLAERYSIPVSANTVQTHRRGDCACPR
jgi:hypothetical protein